MTESVVQPEAKFSSNLLVSKAEKAKIATVYVAIGIVTSISLAAATIIGHISPVMSGLGIVAYVLGLRHGVDADHIAAIDNTTRKLIQQNKPRFTVGTWFSLGHSTIVFGLIASIVFVTRTIIGSIPSLQSWGSIAGTLISGAFLCIIGFMNLLIVFGVYHLFTQARLGNMNEQQLEKFMANRGFLNRLFRPLFKFVNDAWQIYPIGVLFGLGFDTATEVALIAISVGVGVSSSVPLWQIMVLPLLFTCGMVLTDTSDGVTMRCAYAWAFLTPLKKIFYNLTVTVMSVLVAFVIGGVEIVQVLSSELGLNGSLWVWFNNLDFETMGFAIVGIFVVTWGAAYLVWKYKKYDQYPSSLIVLQARREG
jgi:nickel/cobalt transporter (NiCoT) family protein